jgi:hypothetical protein
MTPHRMRNRLVAGALVAGLVIGVPTTAMAATPSQSSGKGSPSISSSGPLNPKTKNPTTFNAAKAFVEHQLALRQQRLANLTNEVAKAADLTSSDRATLTSDLSSETAGINALAAKVPNDTTWAELKADAKSMVVDYRVFVVMSPQVHLTIAADTESAIEQKLQAAEPKIEALIRYEQSKGKDVHGAQVAYDALVVEVAGAEHDTAGVSAAVLATSPSGYPANMTIFLNAHSNLLQGRAALAAARSDLHTIAKDLGL